MDNNVVKIFSLGGLREIGKNCYVFEKDNDLIIIDCGVKFSSDENIDGIIPNFSYLSENRDKIKGLFITHAHEDHVGAIVHLSKEIPDLPIYGSEFSISLIKQRFIKLKNKPRTFIFQDDTVFFTNEFKISFFRVTHSIPGSFGIIIECRKIKFCAIVTGDFKFDWTEIGERTDLMKLAETGKKGVDLLLSDSTNAEVKGSTPSERKVVKRLENIILNAPGRIIITSFASNVYRLREIIDIAKKGNKKISLLGSTLGKMLKAIQKASIWKIESSIFIKSSEIDKIPKNKVVIFCTGSQGEKRAVLSKLANQTYPGLKIDKDDYIILTSSPIMDNRLKVSEISDKLFALGAKIFENDRENLIHTSGHACQEDLKLMLRLVNPRFFMPMHGNFRMLRKHAILAMELGINKTNIFVCRNGEVINFFEDKAFISKEEIDAEPNFVISDQIVRESVFNKLIINNRLEMSKSGLVIIFFFWNERKKKIGEYPYMFTYGFIKIKDNEELLNFWRTKINKFVSENKNFLINSEKWRKEIEEYAKKEVFINLKDKPYIKVIFESKPIKEIVFPFSKKLELGHKDIVKKN